eukprot:TRINITY_DN75982_c0_g1_i1.p1 TRINITY_DN75982_c0_g1~~TRINITY_DN75982_c0_g1_i1.p1  ORF type:complete len:296 (-),score=34.94 TRINITY_DN75982_c0_g1_i1:168-1055(-)
MRVLFLRFLVLLLLCNQHTTLCEEEHFFPQQFSVVVGTTVAQTNFDAIAQSGTIYFDYAQQRMRVDNWFLESRHTFLALYNQKKVYFINNGHCKFSAISEGELLPYSLPTGSVKHSEPQMVRGGLVNHFEAAVPTEEMLQKVDFYVKSINTTTGRPRTTSQTTTTPTRGIINIPWRTTYERSRRPELSGTPVRNGDEAGDVSFSPFGSAVAGPDIVRQVISDYYNFNPTPPDDDIFIPPPICDQAAHDIFKGMDETDQVFSTQKRLVDLSLFEGERRFLQPPPEPKVDDDLEQEL